jgi:hypothetical protein
MMEIDDYTKEKVSSLTFLTISQVSRLKEIFKDNDFDETTISLCDTIIDNNKEVFKYINFKMDTGELKK